MDLSEQPGQHLSGILFGEATSFNFLINLLIERERSINLLFHFIYLFMYVDSCMCPDWGLNLQSWLDISG